MTSSRGVVMYAAWISSLPIVTSLITESTVTLGGKGNPQSEVVGKFAFGYTTEKDTLAGGTSMDFTVRSYLPASTPGSVSTVAGIPAQNGVIPTQTESVIPGKSRAAGSKISPSPLAAHKSVVITAMKLDDQPESIGSALKNWSHSTCAEKRESARWSEQFVIDDVQNVGVRYQKVVSITQHSRARMWYVLLCVDAEAEVTLESKVHFFNIKMNKEKQHEGLATTNEAFEKSSENIELSYDQIGLDYLYGFAIMVYLGYWLTLKKACNIEWNQRTAAGRRHQNSGRWHNFVQKAKALPLHPMPKIIYTALLLNFLGCCFELAKYSYLEHTGYYYPTLALIARCCWVLARFCMYFLLLNLAAGWCFTDLDLQPNKRLMMLLYCVCAVHCGIIVLYGDPSRSNSQRMIIKTDSMVPAFANMPTTSNVSALTSRLSETLESTLQNVKTNIESAVQLPNGQQAGHMNTAFLERDARVLENDAQTWEKDVQVEAAGLLNTLSSIWRTFSHWDQSVIYEREDFGQHAIMIDPRGCILGFIMFFMDIFLMILYLRRIKPEIILRLDKMCRDYLFYDTLFFGMREPKDAIGEAGCNNFQVDIGTEQTSLIGNSGSPTNATSTSLIGDPPKQSSSEKLFKNAMSYSSAAGTEINLTEQHLGDNSNLTNPAISNMGYDTTYEKSSLLGGSTSYGRSVSTYSTKVPAVSPNSIKTVLDEKDHGLGLEDMYEGLDLVTKFPAFAKLKSVNADNAGGHGGNDIYGSSGSRNDLRNPDSYDKFGISVNKKLSFCDLRPSVGEAVILNLSPVKVKGKSTSGCVSSPSSRVDEFDEPVSYSKNNKKEDSLEKTMPVVPYQEMKWYYFWSCYVVPLVLFFDSPQERRRTEQYLREKLGPLFRSSICDCLVIGDRKKEGILDSDTSSETEKSMVSLVGTILKGVVSLFIIYPILFVFEIAFTPFITYLLGLKTKLTVMMTGSYGRGDLDRLDDFGCQKDDASDASDEAGQLGFFGGILNKMTMGASGSLGLATKGPSVEIQMSDIVGSPLDTIHEEEEDDFICEKHGLLTTNGDPLGYPLAVESDDGSASLALNTESGSYTGAVSSTCSVYSGSYGGSSSSRSNAKPVSKSTINSSSSSTLSFGTTIFSTTLGFGSTTNGFSSGISGITSVAKHSAPAVFKVRHFDAVYGKIAHRCWVNMYGGWFALIFLCFPTQVVLSMIIDPWVKYYWLICVYHLSDIVLFSLLIYSLHPSFGAREQFFRNVDLIMI